ncbi:MAG TPA: hypothetical protein PK312_02120, partial [Nitrospira sp.]|nr:hypothetical protein [Nitrospira sp.]
MAIKKTKKAVSKKSPSKKSAPAKPTKAVRPAATRTVAAAPSVSSTFNVVPAPAKKLQLTEVALRDGHQCLLATRMRTEDMLPIAQKLDSVGFWSLEVWGGATFDTCL